MENQENCSTPVMTTETAGCAAVLKKKLSDETSKKIAAIRIILMILVVFAHNNYNELFQSNFQYCIMILLLFC